MTTETTKTLADPEVMIHPFEYYDWMRKNEPVHFDEKIGAYLITRYEDIKQALNMPDVFSSEEGFGARMQHQYYELVNRIMDEESTGPFGVSVNIDPPRHGAVRGLIDHAFTAQRVAAMEDYLTQVVSDCIDTFIDTGEADLTTQLAEPVPCYVIADALGLPRDISDKMIEWSLHAVANAFGAFTSEEQATTAAHSLAEMKNYLNAAIKDRREERKDDMISDLVYAELTNEKGELETLSDDLLANLALALVVAGNETTTNGISFSLLVLAQDPELFKLLKHADNQDLLLKKFVEESLRVNPPVPQLPRCTLSDVEIGGTVIPKGSMVFLCYGSANRDDARYQDAEQMDFDRKAINQHMSFGAGIHRCVGAMLARMEMKIAIREIVNRVDNLKLAVPVSEVPVYSLLVNRGLQSLPVTFDKAVTTQAA